MHKPKYMLIYWQSENVPPCTKFFDDFNDVKEDRFIWKLVTGGTIDVYVWTGTHYKYYFT